MVWIEVGDSYLRKSSDDPVFFETFEKIVIFQKIKEPAQTSPSFDYN